jgi:hypothetical protein
MKRLFVLTLAVLALSGCGHRTGSVSAQDALKITQDRLTSGPQPKNPSDYRPSVKDEGYAWRVTYLFTNGTGGTIVFLVEKKSGKIIRAQADQ